LETEPPTSPLTKSVPAMVGSGGGGGGGMPDAADAADQGLTLVHFSAQVERLQWDRGCM